MILLSLTYDTNAFYRLDEGWTRFPYFIAGIFIWFLILHLVDNKK